MTMLLDEFKESIRNLKYVTRMSYINQIELFFKQHSDIKEFPDFLKKRQNTLRKAAINKYLYLLKNQGKNVDFIIGQIELIKCSVKEREEYQTLLESQANLLISSLLEKNEKKYYTLAVLCMISLDTGSRIKAMLKLRKRDIVQTEDGTSLNLHEKGSVYTLRRITPETLAHLKECINLDTTQDNTYLFFNTNKVSETQLIEMYYYYWKILKNFSRKLFGIGISFHWIRRSAGQYIYKKTGKNPIAVAEFYHHKNVGTTQRYLKIQGEAADKVIKKTKRPW